MLLTRQNKKSGPPELNMASMIDVVFLLLIFFMCTSSFEKLENTMPSNLPGKSADDSAPDELFEPVRIEVRGMAEGVLVTVDGSPCRDFDALAGKLKARRAIADLPVVIAGEDRVPFEYMVGALDSCYRANLRKVAFSAKGLK
jgi:biopolymer transport protein ExbD